MDKFTLPKGTVLHWRGIPVELTEDTVLRNEEIAGGWVPPEPGVTPAATRLSEATR
jgi:hypothetical protein